MISVIVPTFNTPREYLDQCLASVLEQTHRDLELIVVDDGSTQPFSGLDKEFTDERIRWFACKENAGVCVARNYGISVALGEMIAFLDSDDWWDPIKLELQLSSMGSINAGWSYTSIIVVDKGGRILRESEALYDGKIFDILLREMIVTGSTSAVMVTRDLLSSVGGFDQDSDLIEDWDLWLRLAKCAPVTYVKKPIVFIRSFSGESRSSKLSAKLVRLRRLQEKYSTEYKSRGMCAYTKAHYYYVASRQHYIARNWMESISFLLKSFLAWPFFYSTGRLHNIINKLLIFRMAQKGNSDA